MSCCAFPPPSKEPLYPMHPMLAHLVAQWEQAQPGFGAEVAQAIGLGNMDRDDWEIQEGMPVFPYQLHEQFQVAVETVEHKLLARERQRLLVAGPWHVRLGFSKPKPVLCASEAQWLAQAKADATALLRTIQAMGHWNPISGETCQTG